MAQAVHPRFPIEGDEGQQSEEDDQRGLEAIPNYKGCIERRSST